MFVIVGGAKISFTKIICIAKIGLLRSYTIQAWANPEKISENPENTDNYFWKTFTNISILIITFGKYLTYKYG